MEDLTGDRVWHSRAMVLLGQAVAATRPGEAIELAGRALCRFQAMALSEDERSASRVLALVSSR